MTAAADASPPPTPRPTEEMFRRRVLVMAVVVALLAAVYAAYGIWLNPLRPHVTTPLGYYGYVDQSYYLRTAHVLAKLRLPAKPRDYFYGLGYPVLGAFFSRLGFRGDPFAPADVLLFGGIAALTFVLTVRLWRAVFGVFSALAGLFAVAILVFSSPLFQFVITPYNAILVVFLLLSLLVLVTSDRKIGWSRGIGIGILLGWVLAARYGDVVFAALPVAAAVFVRPRGERVRLALGGAVGLLVMIVIVGYTQYHAFGNPLITPYHFHNRLNPGLGNDQSLKNYRLGWIPMHFLGVVITGRLHGRSVGVNPMLLQFPLLPLAPIGMFVLIRRARDARAIWVAATVGFVVSSLFYLAFVAGGAGDLPYGNLRYWAMWYPLCAILAAIGVNALVQRIQRFTDHRAPVLVADRARGRSQSGFGRSWGFSRSRASGAAPSP